MTQSTTKTQQRSFVGMVMSDKMDKTVVVKVERTVVHPKYGKRYVRSTRLKAHDEENVYKTGDKVRIIECRPLSRHKRWFVKEKLA
jgi:small subunit ribosomal protein S17